MKIDKKPEIKLVHGVELTDNYAWLRAKNWQEVLRNPKKLPKPILEVLKSENKNAARFMKNNAALITLLKKEMRGRIADEDESVPVKNGDYTYFSRFKQGAEHPAFFRTYKDGEELLIDASLEAEGYDYYDIGGITPSNDHQLLAWSDDKKGNELYEIKVKGLSDCLKETTGEVVWGADNSYFYYLKINDEHRANRLFKHILGQKQAKDVLIYEERDNAFFLSLGASKSGDLAFLTPHASDISEILTLDLKDINAEPRMILSRELGAEFTADFHPAYQGKPTLFIETNEGAENYCLKLLDFETLKWGETLVEHSESRLLIDFALYQNWLVTLTKSNALPSLTILCLNTGETHEIDFQEAAFTLDLDEGENFETNIVRFSFASPRFPEEIYDYDMALKKRVLMKRVALPSGHDPLNYDVKRVYIKSHDGVEVPVTTLAKKGVTPKAPLYLEAYGAYGISFEAGFDSDIFSLVDKGVVYAIAHVRGGMDCGYSWYKTGKLEHKRNTFLDTIAVADGLCALNITSKGNIVFHGGSAGGMLAGAVANLAPSLFAGIIARVPFVDVVNTMLDANLPLTPPEWSEWGNPIKDETAFFRILSYSPYENIKHQDYPHLLVLGGISDPRVTYWEPAKFVAKLRDYKTDSNELLFYTNLTAGHAGSSGRFERLDETAWLYAFALTVLPTI